MYKKNTKIAITIRGDGSEIFDYSLPHPHEYYRQDQDEQIYTIKYFIDGVFNTNKGYEYLNDILARFTLSMSVLRSNVIRTEEDDAIGYKLNQFNGLKSVVGHKNYEAVNCGMDNLFYAIKYYTEDLIRASGEGNLVAYSLIESFAFARFIDRAKDRSTLKAKCRSIWNWYDARDWTIPERGTRTLEQYLEETMATRSEHMIKLNEKRASENYKKVVNIITGLFNDEYKKKSGAWHIGKIADELGLNRDTVSKYIKEYQTMC